MKKRKTVSDMTQELTDRFFYQRLAMWGMRPHKEVAELLKLKKLREVAGFRK